MERIDVAVIGAGVTGLAAARAIAERGRTVVLLERHPRAGQDTSTHNSGVIHAGMYYPSGSLKARLCVDGRRRLYEFCAKHGVPNRKCGKLVVGHDAAEMQQLEALKARGDANGVEGLEIVDRSFIADREPAVDAPFALWSPETGIVEAEALVRALLRTGQDAGVVFLPGTPLAAAESRDDGVLLRTAQEDILAATVVNAAGLYADDVSRMLHAEDFTIYPCRGEYVALSPAKRSMVNGLVYPLPHVHSLGVHIVKTLSGDVWLGPTARFQDRKDDYESDRIPLEDFLEPARQLLPELRMEDLRLGGSGIRAKLHPPDVPFSDFMIERDAVNPRVIQVAGIESPGLTSCLSIAEQVAGLVEETL